MPDIPQIAFVRGEASPLAEARTDQAFYANAVALASNFFVRAEGALSNRAGLQFVAQCITGASLGSYLVPFIYNNTQSYLCEFAAGSISVYAQGSLVESGITNNYAAADLPNLRWAQSADTLNVAVATQQPMQLKRVTASSFTFTAPTFLNGPFQDVNTDGVSYMYASASQGTVTIFSSAGNFTSQHVGSLISIEEQFLGSIVNWEPNSVLTVSGASPVGMYIRSDGKIYQCVATGALGTGNCMTGQFQPVHTSGTQWDGTGQQVEGNVNDRQGVAWQYVSNGTGIAQITGYTDANHVTAVVQSHKGVVSAFSPTVVGPPITSFGPWTFNGDGSTKTFSPLTGATSTDPNQFLVTVGGVFQDPSLYSISGTSIVFNSAPAAGTGNIVAKQVTGQGSGLAAIKGLPISTYWALGAFSAIQGYPAVVCYFNDRLVFGGTQLQPQTLFTSRVSDYLNFGVSNPQVADDGITATINARRENPIVDLMPLNDLITGTASTIWRITHSTSVGAITPSDIGLLPQNFYGQQPVASVQTGDTIIYVQWGGRKIRDLVYQFMYDKFMGTELTVFARHMFPVGTSCTRIAFAPEPFGLLYCIRSDGVLCVCAYLPEQQIIAWTRYTTAGYFEDVQVIPENGSYTVYVIVRRTVNSSTVRYIEKFMPREYATPQDAFFVDSGLTYDGRNTSSTTMTLTGGTTWLANDTGTLTASSSSGWAGFQSTDPGNNNAIWLYQTFTFLSSVGNSAAGKLTAVVTAGAYTFTFSDGESRLVTVAADGLTVTWKGQLADKTILAATVRCRLQITAITSATVAAVKFLDPVPKALQGAADATWTFARTNFSGLTNLVAATVSVFADGAALPQQVVSATGTITLPSAGGVVHAGLPYTSQLQSLPLNIQGEPPIRNRQKTTTRLSVVVDESTSLYAGPDFTNLRQLAVREFESYGQPPSPHSGVVHVNLETEPSDDAVLCIQHSDPVPLSILAWFLDTDVGEAA